MPEHDDISVARELGAISQQLVTMNDRLGKIEVHVSQTNGRVKQHDIDIAVIHDRDERDAESKAQLREDVKDLKGRPRIWAIGVGGPLLASLATVLLAHHGGL